jgi:hypothetical protein
MDFSIAEDLDYEVNGVLLTFDSLLRNTGTTPAINAFVDLGAFSIMPRNVDQERERVCSLGAAIGVDVFPGDKLSPWRFSTNITKEQV